MIKEIKDNLHLSQVINLQKQFVKENICNGITSDDLSTLSQKVVFGVFGEDLVGYAYGMFEYSSTDKTYCKKGDKTFYLEEIYITPDCRNKGYGKQLYAYIENFAKHQDCKNIQVVAVSKDYKQLMNFYIDQLGFNFWSAWLIKQL